MKTSVSLLHWLPRAICILAILFISLFAFDAFSPEYTFLQQVGRFFVHLTPSIILTIILAIAWKRELIGGVIFGLVSIGLSPMIYEHNYNLNHSITTSIGIVLMVIFPFVVVAALFIVSHFKKKQNS
jgi:hypothetical protein